MLQPKTLYANACSNPKTPSISYKHLLIRQSHDRYTRGVVGQAIASEFTCLFCQVQTLCDFMLNFTLRIRDLIYFSVLTEKSPAILRGFVNPAQKKLEKETSIYLFFQYCKSSVRKNSSAPNIQDSDELLKLNSNDVTHVVSGI